MESTKLKKSKAHGGRSGLAGEMLVAGELLRRGWDVSFTFGNTRGLGLTIHDPDSKATMVVQVKALASPNYHWISHAKIVPDYLYAFVLLNAPDGAVEYAFVPGIVLKGEPQRFGKWFTAEKNAGIHWKDLASFRNKWPQRKTQAD